MILKGAFVAVESGLPTSKAVLYNMVMECAKKKVENVGKKT